MLCLVYTVLIQGQNASLLVYAFWVCIAFARAFIFKFIRKRLKDVVIYILHTIPLFNIKRYLHDVPV